MSAPLFSILICHLESREAVLQRLLDCLAPQLEGCSDLVEVLVETDNGEITTGAKRNILLAKARGEYVAFIDDDDLVAPNYVSLILDALTTRPDTVGIRIHLFYPDGRINKSVRSLKYANDGQSDDPPLGKMVWTPAELQEFVTNRHPAGGSHIGPTTHLNPSKRALALLVGYPDLSWSEDTAYSDALYPHLRTEVCIETPLYFYYPSVRNPEAPSPHEGTTPRHLT